MAQRTTSKKTTGAEELCQQAFSRCSNWPSDFLGQKGLADGLKIASDRSGVTQEEIVARCREFSAWCPTDADLLRIAHDIDAERKRAAGGPPPWRSIPKCTECNGTGWRMEVRAGQVGHHTRQRYDAAIRCSNGCEIPDQARFGGGA